MYQASGINNFVEQDGCARTVIVLLLLTTVGCVSYTWGYYEGIANSQSNLMLDKLHEAELAQMLKHNHTRSKVFTGHGLHSISGEPQRSMQQSTLLSLASGGASASTRFGDATSAGRSGGGLVLRGGSVHHSKKVPKDKLVSSSTSRTIRISLEAAAEAKDQKDAALR